jgi:general secretion pathway protein G
MLAIRPQLHARLASRRRAFTLLEVLVVVAILVILASVAGIYVFKQLDDAKESKAKLDMKTLETVFEAYTARNGGTPPQSLAELVPDLKQGQAALIDPWGNPYQFQAVETEVGPRVQFFTTTPDGKTVVWPEK